MSERNYCKGDRSEDFSEGGWAKRAHDRGKLPPRLRKLFYEYMEGYLPRRSKDE